MAPKDPRFARLSTDPRFLRPSKASQKIVLDDRFKSLLEDEGNEGETSAKVDKYGKKVAKGKNKQALKSFYRLDEKKKGVTPGLDLARGEGLLESSSEEEDDDEEEEDDDEVSEAVSSDDEGGEVLLGSKEAQKAAARRDRAASEGSIDLDEDVPVASTSTLQEAAVEENVPMMENSTKRIAVVNLDWDNVRAIDLYKVFDSVLSSSASTLLDGSALGSRKSKSKIAKGSVDSVRIYPSDFGKKRMEREEKEGPPLEIFSKNKRSSSNAIILKKAKTKKKRHDEDEDEDDITDSEDEDQEEYDEVALRRYQLERLRYYYAVVTFDSVSASQHAYDEIDGSEFEATANVLDLRFVPDDVTFDDKPTDEVTSKSIDLQSYKPGEFVTDALRNSKVKLTWDQDDPERLKLVRGAHPGKDKKQKGKGKQEEVIDYSALLASDSEDDGAKRSRLREAFGLGDTPLEEHEGDDDSDDGDERDVDMEVTFGPALDGEGEEEENDDEDNEGEKEETSLEAYQRKERERRERKKAKRIAEKKKGAGKGRVVIDQEDDSDPDEAFDANAFGEADGLDAEDGGVDAFFDGQVDEEEDDDDDHEVISSAKISKKAQRQLEREAKDKEAASLSLLMGGSDGGNSGDEDGLHFDMQAILRAEKVSSKPKKMLKKGKDRRKHDDAKKLLEREKDKFEIDLKDDRFSKLHEDHEFALDPSSNKFVKTKNMDRLLQESRKRRNNDAPVEGDNINTAAQDSSKTASSGKDGLSSLVESIKRKSQSSSSAAPKAKEGKHKKKKQKTV